MRREDEIAIASCAYGSRGSSIDFTAGVKWADANPKSPWISIKDDLPCNHEELIDGNVTHPVFVRNKNDKYDVTVMAKFIKWDFIIGDITHWFPIPELPKGGD